MEKDLKSKKSILNSFRFLAGWVIPATLIGYSTLVTWDYINLAYHWSDDSGMTINFIILLLSCILIPISINVARKNSLKRQKIKIFFISGIILQIFTSWILYSKFHQIFPFQGQFYPDISTPAGWYTMEVQTMYLLAAWFAATYILMIPFGIGWIVSYNKFLSEQEAVHKFLKMKWNVTLILIALLMGLRWGTIWTTPLHNIIYSLILGLVFLLCEEQGEQNQKSEPPASTVPQPSLAEISLLSMLFVSLECSLDGLLSKSLYWLILIPISAGFLFVNHLVKNKMIRKILSWGSWIASGLGLTSLLFANIFYWAGITPWIWYSFIFTSLASYPLFSTTAISNHGSKKKRQWNHWLRGLVSLISMICVFGANLYDPFSTYLIITLILTQIIFLGVREIRNAKNTPKSRELTTSIATF